ncbi:hypothetical protein BGX38DRAFT_1234393 [Terfezia claveryi]|nr:hypothetical protein BGX38DRAFT_1234393 [Terfezia claveryi]
MRALLNQAHYMRKVGIEKAIRRVIRTYNWARMDEVNYKTISGRLEGIFGWAAANYEANAGAGPATFAGNDGGGCGYVEIGGQTMQIAFHCPADLPGALPKAVTRNILIGRNFRVFSHCWEDRGANATWQKHRDSLYNGSGKPQVRPLDDDARKDNCLPRGVSDGSLPCPPGPYPGYTGNGRFIACIKEILSLAGSYFLNADAEMELRRAGFLLNDLPQDARNAANELAEWKGAATFFYGVRTLIANAPGYNPIALMREVIQLQTGTIGNYQARQNGREAEHFCKAVFNAVYTSVTLHNGFGIKIFNAESEEVNSGTLRDALAQGLPAAEAQQEEDVQQRQHVQEQLDAWPENEQAPLPVRALVGACVTQVQLQAKSYSVIVPDSKPWAQGAAVIYAHHALHTFRNLVEF